MAAGRRRRRRSSRRSRRGLPSITPGYRNRFGHPRPDVVARYDEAGIRSYRTDYDGALTFRFAPGMSLSSRAPSASTTGATGARHPRATPQLRPIEHGVDRRREGSVDSVHDVPAACAFSWLAALGAPVRADRDGAGRRSGRRKGQTPGVEAIDRRRVPHSLWARRASAGRSSSPKRVMGRFRCSTLPGATLAHRDPAREFRRPARRCRRSCRRVDALLVGAGQRRSR